MAFVRKKADLTPIVDTVFSIVAAAAEDKAANGPENVTDATIGSLFGEDGKLVAFDTVFDHYDAIDHRIKAAYAASFTGNPSYRETVWDWVLRDKVDLCGTVIAATGGSGAVSISVTSFLDEGETLIIPEIAWGSYSLMAHENGIRCETYNMFDGDAFTLSDLKDKVNKVMAEEGRAVVVVNDPCHNPTGYTMTKEEWQELIEFLNECSEKGPCILINDIAYIDYSYDPGHSRDYMEAFNEISPGVMISVCFSCSKTMTSYGLRCGAAVILARRAEDVREAEIVLEKKARSIWSNIPNAAMENFTWTIRENREAFEAEKQKYIDLMKQRSDIFLREAAACGLEVYPYREGFFITLKMENNTVRDAVHQAFMDRHIYTVAVNKGIRVAVCSLPLKKAAGLAAVMKEIEESVLKR